MKKSILTLLAFFAFIQSSVAKDIIATIDDISYILDTEKKTATVKKKIGIKLFIYQKEVLNFPASVEYEGETYSTMLAESSFSSAPNLTTVSFQGDIKSIPSGCFNYCTKLETVNIPVSVESIYASAFEGCSSLKKIDLPPNLKNLGTATYLYGVDEPKYGGVFAYSGLTSITIPSGVKMIGDNCFLSCTSLSQVKLSEGLEIIGRYAFNKTAIQELSLPESLKIIGNAAFKGIPASEIIIPDNVEFIGSRCFAESEINKIDIPDKVTVLRAFLVDNTKINEFTIKATVTDLNPCGLSSAPITKLIIDDCSQPLNCVYDVRKDYGYQETSSLGGWFNKTATNVKELYLGRNISVTIPEENSTVALTEETADGLNPFKDFTDLHKLTLGNEVTDATMLNLAACRNLTTIEVKSMTPPTIKPFSEAQKSTVKLIVPEDALDAFKSAPEWKDLVIVTSSESSLSNIDGDTTSKIEYFNLQGVRVENPSKGIFIRKQGSSVTKIAL